MHPSEHVPAAPLRVGHRPWPVDARHPDMANTRERRPGLDLTNRHLVRDGAPWIPVSGEMHYSRVPRARWAERLRLMRAGGVDVVATYVPWIHHEEHRGRPRFDGALDVAAFVDEAAATGLDVVLRIGPWAHAELRNGGFPDWVQAAPVRHRTDDPAYLELVRAWFATLGAAVGDRCGPDGPVLGVQLENELYDQPGHLLTLKAMAREAGLHAPLWTATAWGGARLPADEVLPVYGGYCDGFWVDADAPWDPTFREHFFFSDVWDDPGIGADVRRAQNGGDGTAPGARLQPDVFPAATCELGGGMATAYHCRPWPAAADLAAVAHCKIGNGSAWQGYYMYAGGTNPPGDDGLQESHATGYPNDLPRLSYDFHAAVGQAGDLAPSHAVLRRQHAFLDAFGDLLARSTSSLPEVRPTGVDDASTLRWALRCDGRSGFVLVAWHQPHVPLPTYRGARFTVGLADAEVTLPTQPVDVPAGTLARWPVGLQVGGVHLAWATASALTVLDGPVPTLVLTEDPGVPVEIVLAPDPDAGPDAPRERLTPRPGRTPVHLATATGACDVLVLPEADLDRLWVAPAAGPAPSAPAATGTTADAPDARAPRRSGRRLLLTDADLGWGADGVLHVRTTGTCARPEVLVYDPLVHGFVEVDLAPADDEGTVATAGAEVPVHLVRAPGEVPVTYGARDGRASAPTRGQVAALAGVHRLDVPAWALRPGADALLAVTWAGDVAELHVDGRPVDDRFWDGSRWLVSLVDAGAHPGSEVTLHVVPLHPQAPVRLPAAAGVRRGSTAGAPLCAVDEVQVLARRRWVSSAVK